MLALINSDQELLKRLVTLGCESGHTYTLKNQILFTCVANALRYVLRYDDDVAGSNFERRLAIDFHHSDPMRYDVPFLHCESVQFGRHAGLDPCPGKRNIRYIRIIELLAYKATLGFP
jgi:hypothetical protein